MTRLLIDGKDAVLSESFKATIYEENQFFTKNGLYTFDIELSLENYENKQIYKNINRINSDQSLSEDTRSAVLLVGNDVVLNGIEQILDITESTVSIRLMSGGSEFNYLIGGDRKVRDLDLGSVDIGEDFDSLVSMLDYSYPDVDWLVLPYYDRNSPSGHSDTESKGVVGNKYLQFGGKLEYAYNKRKYQHGADYTNYSNYRPQPFLCFIIRKVFQALGYNISYSALEEHPLLKKAYIVHGINTHDFAKMLPDWTVEEFLSQIETLFDGTFLFDKNSKDVEFRFFYEQADSLGTTDIEILDEYEQNVDNTNRKKSAVSNIAYDLSDDIYYKYQRLEDNIPDLSRFNYKQFTTLPDLVEYFKVPGFNDFDSIFHVHDIDTEFIAYKYYENVSQIDVILPMKVNSLSNLINNPKEPTKIDYKLKIMPAPMYPVYRLEGDWQLINFMMQYPIADNPDPFWEEKDFEDYQAVIYEIIEENKERQTENTPSRILLAFYDGLKQPARRPYSNPIETTQYLYPISFTEDLPEYFRLEMRPQYESYYGTQEFGTGLLRLKSLNDKIYTKSGNVDTRKTYVFKFITKGKIDIRSIFIIRNKRFVCKKIEREVGYDGYASEFIGEFYPLI
jgi:hypothetical protein